MIKLLDLLKEVGEGSQKPYKWELDAASPNYSEYTWTTEEGVEYEASIDKFRDEEESNKYMWTVNFGIRSTIDSTRGPYSYVSYSATSKTHKTGNLFRVMATMVEILKTEIKEDASIGRKTKEINASPHKATDKDRRRTNLYKAYVEKHMPNSKVLVYANGDMKILLP